MPEALTWPLVGREEELEQIAAARVAGGGRGVVLRAAVGVGKSRLARQAVAEAEHDGAFAVWVQATRSAASVPLGACAGLLAADVRSDDLLELMRRSADSLRDRAGGRPIVLGVDDAQLLDPTSAALILHLAVTGAAFLVVTLRSGEPFPDAVESLWKDAGAVRLQVAPLDEAATAALVEAALGGLVTRSVSRWVFDSSRGNVLYARELVHGALADGALHETGGIWRLARRPPPNQSLSDLISGRMADLSASERAVLELLALGEPLGLSEVVDLAGAEAVEALDNRGLLNVTRPVARSFVRLAHPLYGEVVAGSIGVLRASQVRRRLAETLRSRGDRSPDDALRIARWLLDADEPIPPPLLVEAAGAAVLSGDPELGAQLAQLALDGGAGVTAASLLARALSVRGRHDEAEAVLAAVEGDLEEPAVAVAYLQQRTFILVWGLSRPADAVALLDRARGWWPDRAWRREVDALRLLPVSLALGFAEAAEVSAGMLEDPELDPATRRRTELSHASNLLFGGQTSEARELIRRHRPEIPLRDELDVIALGLWCGFAQESGWDVDEARAWMTRALQDAVRANDHAAAAVSAVTVGTLHANAGRYDDARRWYLESLVHAEQRDPFQSRAAIHASLVGVAYFTGDSEGAAAAMRRCREAAAAGPLGDGPLWEPHRASLVRAEGWAALAEGDPPKAQRLLLEGAVRSHRMPLYSGQLYHEALRAGAPAARLVGPMAALRGRCDAPLMVAYADHVDAAAARDGRALLGCADAFAAIGALRYGAESAATAAEAFAAEGREDSARRAAVRSQELHARGKGGFAPEIRGLQAAAVELTPREAQLIDLAAHGLSNAEIADRLVVSVRTVESHLYHAMQKLGISDRRDLAVRG